MTKYYGCNCNAGGFCGCYDKWLKRQKEAVKAAALKKERAQHIQQFIDRHKAGGNVSLCGMGLEDTELCDVLQAILTRKWTDTTKLLRDIEHIRLNILTRRQPKKTN
jgi:hypothetical protein